MLEKKKSGRYAAVCDKCRHELELEGMDVDAMRVHLGALGWLEAARRGKVRERWLWWCPACAPKPSSSMGPST